MNDRRLQCNDCPKGKFGAIIYFHEYFVFLSTTFETIYILLNLVETYSPDGLECRRCPEGYVGRNVAQLSADSCTGQFPQLSQLLIMFSLLCLNHIENKLIVQ